jgi:hypothetical protein
MKSIGICLLFTLCIQAISPAQEIGVSIGYGMYKMDDLKVVNEESGTGDPVVLKTTADFPAYLTFGLNSAFELTNSFILGGEISVTSTGSRQSYSDYSGGINFDQELYSINVSAIPAAILLQDNNNLFTLDAKLGASFTSLSLKSLFRIGDESERLTYKFTSLNFFAEPGLRYGRLVGALPLKVSVRAGYNLQFVKGKLYFTDEDDTYLTAKGEPATADWSGFRAELTVSYLFKRR